MLIQPGPAELAATAKMQFEDIAVSQLTEFLVDTPLTKREEEVLGQIIGAASNKEAACHLGISQ